MTKHVQKKPTLKKKNDAMCAYLKIKQFLLLESTYGMWIKLNDPICGFHSNRNIMATTTIIIIISSSSLSSSSPFSALHTMLKHRKLNKYMLLHSNGMVTFFIEGAIVSCNTLMGSAGRQKNTAFVLSLSERKGMAKRRLGERGGVKHVFWKRIVEKKDFRA